MKLGIGRIFQIVGGILLLGILGLAFFSSFPPPRAPVPAPPNPNGFDDFVQAGKLLIAPTANFDTMTREELQTFVGTNSTALAILRAGLEKSSRVPYSSLTNESASLSRWKTLAQLLAAEGKLAELDGKLEAAAKSYLDAVRFGQEISRGGRLLDGLVDFAIEGIGLQRLEPLAARLDAKSSRETAATLETRDAQRQPWADTLRQERAMLSMHFKLLSMVTRNLQDAEQKAATKFITIQSRTRKLMIQLAARAYELDKGKPAASWSDLVPEYLKTIPKDPTTSTDFALDP